MFHLPVVIVNVKAHYSQEDKVGKHVFEKIYVMLLEPNKCL
jgi:hypothetical protein